MSESMLVRLCKNFVITVQLIVFLGCTHYYVPQQYPLKLEMIPEFKGNQPISVKNTHTSNNIVLLGSQGGHKWMGDLQKWTDTAVGLFKSELGKRDVIITEDAQKELKLTVTKANIYWGFAAIRCIVYLKVETGDGYTREFEGNNPSPWTLYRACDGAITRAVAAMLNDDMILNYIKY